jgi:hypothetical protein
MRIGGFDPDGFDVRAYPVVLHTTINPWILISHFSCEA